MQCCQALPALLGVTLTGLHYNVGNYCTVASLLLASVILFSINIHKNKRRRRRRRTRSHEARKLEESHEKLCRRPSSPLPAPLRSTRSYEECPNIYQSQNSLDEILDLKKPELTCISEEGIADMDLPDNILEELEYLDNITSCAKVENCLMLSEYEQNLIKEKEGPVSLSKKQNKTKRQNDKMTK